MKQIRTRVCRHSAYQPSALPQGLTDSLIIIARPSSQKAVFERVRVFSSVIMVIRPWRQINTAHLDDDFKGYVSGVYTTQLLSGIQSNVQMPSTTPDRRRLRNKYGKNNENVEPIKGVN